MFRNILIPTDGSTLSRKAVKKAVALAGKTHARVTGFHVTPSYRLNIYVDYMPSDFTLPREYEELQKKVATHHLETISKECRAAGVPCTTHFVSSDFAADAIVKAAKKYKCDLIAMASHGRSGLSRIFLGSETQKVLANTTIPVLVLR